MPLVLDADSTQHVETTKEIKNLLEANPNFKIIDGVSSLATSFNLNTLSQPRKGISLQAVRSDLYKQYSFPRIPPVNHICAGKIALLFSSSCKA